ncbi:chemotaxis protein CheW [Salimicrobium halophilum]|uniref:Purine-binding chemotaxis protein CheW n=1 Tax=Salimicrobium halophilum TaxID=86666 RepID=A0A1G8Q9S1_9BACI|nr:chemotaxis protein CheW [Salimicrobium halophilum]SDJ01441.1 purine-binding chemotaxis protein CheW [Salimicrobium halophilum]
MAEDFKVIVFQVEDEEYAIPVDQVHAIERMMPITRVPGTPDFVEGVMNLRGVVTPVIHLRERFGLSRKENGDHTRVIIVAIEQMSVGLVVDHANDVLDLNESQVEPPPEVVGNVEAEYIQGVAKVGKRLLVLLSLEKVLSKEELLKLEATEGPK